MMPAPDQIVIPVGPLQLVFWWYNDRYAHYVARTRAFDDEMPERRYLDSMEGMSNNIWPDSPPLQECHLEGRSDGRIVALLVGRAGTSHWSLSVLCDPAAGSLLFEVACRLRGEPEWLGSRYAASRPRPGDVSSEIVLEVPASGDSWGLPAYPAGSRNLPTRISVPAPQSAGSAARTVQWSYFVRPATSP